MLMPMRRSFFVVFLALAAVTGCGTRTQLEEPIDGARPDVADAAQDGRSDGTTVTDLPAVTDGGPAGCQSNADCGGVTTRCRLDTRQCVACLTGTDCAAGSSCVDFACVAPCRGGACPTGATCCGDLCIDARSSLTNCGGCGVTCPPVARGTPACTASTCGVGACDRGFGDCDRSPANGCERDVTTDPANCGGCGTQCAAGQSCVGGACTTLNCAATGCLIDLSCCGTACIPTQTDPNNCGGCNLRCAAGQTCVGGACNTAPTSCPTVPCGANQACCGGTCRPVRNDPNNCGGCDVRCPASMSLCMGMACCSPDPTGTCEVRSCGARQTNCGGTCVELSTDEANCGGCNIRCGTGQTCTGGFCQTPCGGAMCSPGQTCCSNACFDAQSDPTHCGGCGTACTGGPNGSPACRAGVCATTCFRGFFDCNGLPADGCESTLNTNTDCGACGVACGGGTTCTNGMCVPGGCNGGPSCAAGRTCCGAACADLASDAANCGSCARACRFANATSTCTAGACAIGACATGFGNCNVTAADGCEASLQSDRANCGACGLTCAAGLTCTAGTCQRASNGSEGAFLPLANPTYLSPGVHQFTTITVPAGSVVYVAGAGAQAGTLDLRATGRIQIDGTIDVSGGPGSQAVVASRSTQQGQAGTGGYTGELRSAALPTRSCEFATGATGPNGPAVMGTSGNCAVVASTACLARGSDSVFIFAAAPAQFGGGAGVFTGYRAYGSGGGGYAGGGGGALGAAFVGQRDCNGVTAGGGAASGSGGRAMSAAAYDGRDGVLGQSQCDAVMAGVARAWVGGGAGGSIGSAAAADLAVSSSFYAGSGGGGGSADYLQRPAFGGTSGGGGGGGVLRLWSETDMVVNGRLLANGGAGGDAYLGTPVGAGCDPQPGAAGGGGSGGLIYLVAPSITAGATATVSASGGRGGDASVFATGGGGGAGGLGRIRVSVTPTTCALAGTFTPALATGCTPAPATPGRAFLAPYPN